MTDHYKQVAPAGIAPEVTSGTGASRETILAFGQWLGLKLSTGEGSRERVATLSGLSINDLTALVEGRPMFPLDTDHIQRLSTALIETGLVTQASDVWEAAGLGASDYIIAPGQIVRSMNEG